MPTAVQALAGWPGLGGGDHVGQGVAYVWGRRGTCAPPTHLRAYAADHVWEGVTYVWGAGGASAPTSHLRADTANHVG